MLEYKNTLLKNRTMDQHSQALLDLYKTAINIFENLPMSVEYPYAKYGPHNKKSLLALGNIYVYIHKHFPIIETVNYSEQLKICRMHVFNLDKTGSIFDDPKSTRFEISGTKDIWEIPPKTSYHILPIVIIRDAFKYAKLPMASAIAIRRGKEFNPYGDYFMNAYGKIILES